MLKSKNKSVFFSRKSDSTETKNLKLNFLFTLRMNNLNNVHVKLLAFDFLTLSPNPRDPSSFTRKGIHLSRAETVGYVVTRELKPGKFLRFTIDDGTGCISCVLWLNQLTSSYFAKRSPSSVRLIAQVAANYAADVQLGVVARVRGRITGYRGMVQITVSDVVVERDPNVQVLHWLDCVKLARKCYDKLSGNDNAVR